MGRMGVWAMYHHNEPPTRKAQSQMTRFRVWRWRRTAGTAFVEPLGYVAFNIEWKKPMSG